MKTREPLHPEFQISKTIPAFQQPPCEPPHGKEILERFFDVLHSQPKNNRDGNAVAHSVATELDDLWLLGDARIPRNTVPTIKKKVVDFRDLLGIISKKSKKGRPAYEEAVSMNSLYILSF